MMALRRLVESYLLEAGTRTAWMLMATFVAWGIIAVAIVLYASLSAVRIVWATTRAAIGGGAVNITLAIVIWLFVGLTLVLAAAARDVWLRRRDQRWAAETALDNLESLLYPDSNSTAHLERVRDRLAVRALESMEQRVPGRAISKDVGIEARPVALDVPEREGG